MPQQFNPVVDALIGDRLSHFQRLGIAKPDSSMMDRLARLRPQDLFPGQTIADPAMAKCCLSALWLLHDFLDRSHEISQSIESPEGSYWHAIMHRREGDFSNSKYWLRRVGQHPIYADLAVFVQKVDDARRPGIAAKLLSQGRWEPDAWVDLCEAAIGGKGPVAECQKIQQEEWRLLFAYCYEKAITD